MPRVAPQDAKTPRTGKRFWREKLAANIARDRLVNRALRAAGWRVVRIWEHELSECGMRNAERGTRNTEVRRRKADGGRRNGAAGGEAAAVDPLTRGALSCWTGSAGGTGSDRVHPVDPVHPVWFCPSAADAWSGGSGMCLALGFLRAEGGLCPTIPAPLRVLASLLFNGCFQVDTARNAENAEQGGVRSAVSSAWFARSAVEPCWPLSRRPACERAARCRVGQD
jgi:hypothetical protein